MLCISWLIHIINYYFPSEEVMQLFIKDYIVLGVLYYSKLAAHSSKWKSKVILHVGIMAKWILFAGCRRAGWAAWSPTPWSWAGPTPGASGRTTAPRSSWTRSGTRGPARWRSSSPRGSRGSPTPETPSRWIEMENLVEQFRTCWAFFYWWC